MNTNETKSQIFIYIQKKTLIKTGWYIKEDMRRIPNNMIAKLPVYESI